MLAMAEKVHFCTKRKRTQQLEIPSPQAGKASQKPHVFISTSYVSSPKLDYSKVEFSIKISSLLFVSEC